MNTSEPRGVGGTSKSTTSPSVGLQASQRNFHASSSFIDTQQGPDHFARLPTELVAHITEEFECCDLAVFARTCRRAHDFAVPILYEKHVTEEQGTAGKRSVAQNFPLSKILALIRL